MAAGASIADRFRAVAGAAAAAAAIAAATAARGAAERSLTAAEAGEPAEAEWAARRLARLDADFQQELLDLRERVRTLTVSLAETRAEADALRARLERAGWTPETAAPAGRPVASAATVLDFNGDLRLAVLNAGSQAGVRPGLVYQVFRGGLWVARLRALDVRERITGAVVEEAGPSLAPRPGDRAVLGEGPR